ncbi:hypothetical protein [Crocosphaera watsonii]|nr:hypothetical protein [Crocosphaera watsonii]
MASHESFCKNLVDYFRQAALGTILALHYLKAKGINLETVDEGQKVALG